MDYKFRFFDCRNIPDDLIGFENELHIFDREGNSSCDFYAIILDKGKIVGTAKAEIFDHTVSQNLLKKLNSVTNLREIDKPNSTDVIVYLQAVNIYDHYQGKGLCTKLVKFLMKEVRKIDSEYRFFLIYNVSETLEGIPACRCYVRSGEEGGYHVYYDKTKNHWLWGEYFDTLEMAKEQCVGGANMPREYMYVMPKVEGGKKRGKTRRGKTRRSKTRRGKTRRSKTRRSKNKKRKNKKIKEKNLNLF